MSAASQACQQLEQLHIYMFPYYSYTCAPIQPYMCLHTAIYVSSYYYICLYIVVAARVARHRGTGAAAAAVPPRQKCRGVFQALAETKKTDATVFRCDYECGFTGGFEQVSAHVC